jgi:glycosyltransferase involved in cell wall biosynthesis
MTRRCPRLGILAYHPIQYHAPLFQRLAQRGKVELDVLFLSDMGYRPVVDPGFGVSVAWDIDLLSGYAHSFMTTTEHPAALVHMTSTLARWITRQDAVVVNGYTSSWMLLAMALCRARKVPYLLRGSSHPVSHATGMRRHLREMVAHLVVAQSSGGLSMGELNAEFYRRHRARLISFAPNSVDIERFAGPPPAARSDLRERWGLSEDRPLIIFCGKLLPHKRPLDLAAAVRNLPCDVDTLFVGDGLLADRVRVALGSASGAVTGFVNQSELPSYYHAADILVLPSEHEPWGLVVNEAMAAGVLPVVSDRVGCAPDLVRGLGEIFPCGDIASLTDALGRALKLIRDPGIRDRVRQRVARYSIELTAAGFEEAALAVSDRRGVSG